MLVERDRANVMVIHTVLAYECNMDCSPVALLREVQEHLIQHHIPN